ncbi:MAG: response regulator, partial [Chloroflexi bacterium]
DETALFLHRVVADMPEDKQQTIRQLYNKDELLKNKKVLIVDDDMRNSFALAKLLSDKGLIVRIAQNGQKALDLLAEEPADLVLMDIMMPVMDGFEVLAKIKDDSMFRNIPVIIVSAENDSKSVVKGIKQGAEDYLTKPVDPAQFLKKVKEFLG